MKKILFIATGGTIASRRSDSGLKPQITPQELLEYIPQVKDICQIEAIQLLNLDSSNMEPKHWKLIVHTIREQYEAYDGFVIAHGTDTMAYTAAAISYMVQNSKKPIVITGAQKPIDLEITDAKSNLLDSFCTHQMRLPRAFRLFLTERSLPEPVPRRCALRATTHFPVSTIRTLP